jgi:hypothetical protein
MHGLMFVFVRIKCCTNSNTERIQKGDLKWNQIELSQKITRSKLGTFSHKS